MSSTTNLAAAGSLSIPEDASPPTRRPPAAGPVRSLLRRIHWLRLVKRVLLIFAIGCVSYLLIANVLLRTRLLRNARQRFGRELRHDARNSTALRLDYASAYSVVPGRVHLEGLTLRGREQTVEWFLTLDHADVVVSPRSTCFITTFHATRLRSSGFAIRARLRLDRVDATPEVVAALPAIAGFADPPLRDETPAQAPLTDATYHLWTVDLEDVDVEHVREVWIHTLRAEGDTRVRGRWLFHPQRWLDVGPATVDTNGVDFSYGSHPARHGSARLVRGHGAAVRPARGPRARRSRSRLLRRAAGRPRDRRQRASSARAAERRPLQPMGGALRGPRAPGPRNALRRDARVVRNDGWRD